MAFDLRDSGNQAWRFDVSDAGAFSSTAVTSAAVVPRIIRDSGSGTTAWTLGADTQGRITATAGANPVGIFQKIAMLSSGGVTWNLVITSQGILQLMSLPAAPGLGTIVGVDQSYPTPKQPGGAATVVTDPKQTSGEQSGKFQSGCGHSFNSWEIRSVQNGSAQAALVCCPVCSWLARIIVPYSAIHSEANSIILA